MKLNYIFLFCFFIITSATSLKAQVVSGKISDSLQNPLRDIKVMNSRNRMVTFSDENGVFAIQARKNDTLIFNSMFFETEELIVKRNHLNDFNQITLKDKVNLLEAVEVADTLIVQDFDEVAYTVSLQQQLKNDLKNHPEYYMSSGQQAGIDILQTVSLVKGLLGNHEAVEKPFLEYDDLVTLYETDNYFSEEFLTKEIGIEPDKVYSFLDYCGQKYLRKNLLEEDQRFFFVDNLFSIKKSFLKHQ